MYAISIVRTVLIRYIFADKSFSATNARSASCSLVKFRGNRIWCAAISRNAASAAESEVNITIKMTAYTIIAIVSGAILWIAGIILFIRNARKIKPDSNLRICSVIIMVAGVLIATSSLLYKIARTNLTLNHVGGIVFGLFLVSLGLVFIYDTKQALTPKSKSQRRRAIYMIVLGLIILILEVI